MGIGDWELGIGHWAQSPIPNPQSPIPNPHFALLALIIKFKIHNLLLNYKNINLKKKNNIFQFIDFILVSNS